MVIHMSNKHIEMLVMVARGLKELKDKVAFVGGATIGLHIDDPGAPQIRLSDDIDCVVEVTGRVDFYKLDEKLSELGFKHPTLGQSGSICRRVYNGILVDFMPTDENILGFNNRWYSGGLKNATNHLLPDGQTIRIFTLPFLLASKTEAFLDRGKGDFVASPDIEDIVAILDGAGQAKTSILAAPKEVKEYLKNHFSLFLKNESFIESLEGHVTSPVRAKRVKNLLIEIVNSTVSP